MQKRKFKVGDKVVHQKENYGIGLVYDHSPDGEYTRVEWADGDTNGYLEKVLKLHEGTNMIKSPPPLIFP